jgi:hypothetical protein
MMTLGAEGSGVLRLVASGCMVVWFSGGFVSGDGACMEMGMLYVRHAHNAGCLASAGSSWLHRLCNGRRGPSV